jgi:hypothetical protein
MSGWPLPKIHAMPSRSPREEAVEESPANRRRFTRIACPPDASVRLRAGMSARLLDVGLGGALVESSARIMLGSVHATMFVAPDVAFRAQAHVVRAFVAGVSHLGDGGTALVYRAGLEFGTLSPAEAGTLGTFLSKALATMPDQPEAAPQPVAEAVPDRSLSIRFPQGWTVSRKSGAVVAKAPHSSSYMFLGAPQSPPDGELGDRARLSMHEAGFSLLHGQAAEINGLPAWVGFYTGRLNDLGEVIVEAAHVVLNDHIYLVAGVAPWAAFEAVRHDFFATINSFGGQEQIDGTFIAPPPASRLAAVFDFAAASAARSQS